VRGFPPEHDDVDAHGYSAGGDDSDDIAILGEPTPRSHSPYDLAIHTMQEADVPSSSSPTVHSEPALAGGIGVGAWGPPDDGEGMDLDLVTDMAGAGDGALSGVGGLGSGQVSQVDWVGEGLLSGCVAGASVRRGAGQDEAMDFASDLEDPDADDRRPSTGLQAPAGQRRSANEICRRQAKNRVRQNARRQRG
jgi:hypothetical protein